MYSDEADAGKAGNGNGGTGRPRPSGDQPANPERDGATRANRARRTANLGATQDGTFAWDLRGATVENG